VLAWQFDTQIDLAWRDLLLSGLTPDTAVRLDFVFFGDTQELADILRSGLETKGYDVQMVSHGTASGERIAVTGRTCPSTFTHDQLVDWVHAMIAAGIRVGFELDGWICEPEAITHRVVCRRGL